MHNLGRTVAPSIRATARGRLHTLLSLRSARNRSGQREIGNKFDVSRTHLNRRLPKSTHLALTVSHGASRVSSARVQVCVSQDTHATVGHTHALIRPSRDGSRSLSLTLCGAILGTGKNRWAAGPGICVAVAGVGAGTRPRIAGARGARGRLNRADVPSCATHATWRHMP